MQSKETGNELRLSFLYLTYNQTPRSCETYVDESRNIKYGITSDFIEIINAFNANKFLEKQNFKTNGIISLIH